MTHTVDGRRTRKEKKVSDLKNVSPSFSERLWRFCRYECKADSRRKTYIFAIDETDDPYYGKECPQNDGYVIGGRAKKSTKRFYTQV